MACLAICKFVDCAVGLRGFGQHPRRAQNFRESFSSLPGVLFFAETDLPVFDESEVVLSLHDENEQGRLFKMRTW